MSVENDLKSPFSNMFSILQQGHDKALRKAFYNVAAIVFVIFASGIAVAVYHILQPFLRPLLWALLCGTFLYPFKYKLASSLKTWLSDLNSSNIPLMIGVIMLPPFLVRDLINVLGNTFSRNIKIIVGCLISIFLFITFPTLWPLQGFVNFMSKSMTFVKDLSSYFNSFLMWSVVLGYVVVVLFFCNERTRHILKFSSMLLWAAIFFHLVNLLNSTVVNCFSVLIVFLATGGLLIEVIPFKRKQSDSVETGNSEEKFEDLNVSLEYLKEKKKDDKEIPPHMSVSLNECEQVVEKKPFSDYCLITLMWSIILLQLWIYKVLLPIIAVLCFVFLIQFLGNYFGLWSSLSNWCIGKSVHVKNKLISDERCKVLVPRPMRFVLKLIFKGDFEVTKLLDKSIDKICSALIVVMLIFSVGLFALFAALEVHKESMHMVQVSRNIFNRSLHPELTRWLPEDEVIQNALDSMVKNGYVYGREWIGRQLNGFLHGDDASKCHIEKQVLKLWDTLYNSWLSANKTKYDRQFSVSELNINSSLPYIYRQITKEDSNLITFFKDNVDLFMSVIKSIWSVLVSNVALTVKILTSMISIIFGGGTAIFNSLLSMVIFLTTLFYLLASSGDQYKPVELFSSLSPANLDSVQNVKFGKAFQDAIGSVFLVSFKMSTFYGLYTWFTHSLLGIQIVFIPSVLAAVFAAVPFLGTYVAALPAVLELWLVDGQPLYAIILFAAHYLPAFVIDTAFYSEIKGGHPYLTGLAILGGMYWMGLEGAIIGPVLLCCFVVAMHMYQSMLQPETFKQPLRT